MIRVLLRVGLLVVIVSAIWGGGPAQAAFSESFGFNGLGTSTNSGDLATANLFNNVYFTSNGSGTGRFSGLAALPLLSPAVFDPASGSTITFSTTSPTGFRFTNSTYGTFTQTSVAELKSQSFSSTVPSFLTSVTYYIVGSFSGGVIGTATPASVTINFTQNAGPGNPLSASGTLDIPVSVPEPASVVLLGLGLAGVVARRRLTA